MRDSLRGMSAQPPHALVLYMCDNTWVLRLCRMDVCHNLWALRTHSIERTHSGMDMCDNMWALKLLLRPSDWLECVLLLVGMPSGTGAVHVGAEAAASGPEANATSAAACGRFTTRRSSG